MIPLGIILGLLMVLFGLSQALEMIVNAQRSAAVSRALEEK